MTLSRFQTDQKELGGGTFCMTYKGFDTEEKRNVCLKKIKSKMLANDDCKDLIFREIDNLQKLDHPNIVKYYEHFIEDNDLYIVSECIEGGDLESYLEKNKPPLPEKIVLSFFSQLVSGLSHAHSLNIIHCDLKPRDILLTKDHKIKIIDFNASKMVSTLCQTSKTLAGTPGYVALEVLTREGHSFPADVWSLGCVIYELMTGKPPYFHKDIFELRKMLETQNPNPIEGNYSQILKFIVMKMLEKDPNQRIPLKEMQNFLPHDQILQLQTEKQNIEKEKSELQIEKQNLEKEKTQLQIEKQNFEKEKSELQIEKLNLENLLYPHKTQIEKWIGKKKWKLLYKATRDGFKASDFHSKCDKKRPTVTIITSKEGYSFGGYTSHSWKSSNKFAQDSSGQSFIFTLKNPHNIPPSKYPLIKPEYAICCNSDYGPTFGFGYGYADIFVYDQSDQNTFSHTDFPSSYSDTTGKGNITFTGSRNFTSKEIEIFKVSD